MKNSTFLCRKSCLQLILAILFLFAGTGSLSAQISYSAKEPTIGQIIESVKSQTSYKFFYDSQLSGVKVNDVSVTNSTLENLLKEALKGTNVSYKIEDNICYLSTSAPATTKSSSGERVIAGTVTDTKGSPLIGVTITVEGTAIGVATNFDGKYSIKVPGSSAQLQFSYIGYDSQTLTVGTKNTLNVTLQESTIIFDDVVVTAMGIKRETKALTYNVQTVSSDEIMGAQDANVMNSLAGKIAGVTINQSSSGIGGSTRVVMRGTKSLFGDNNALVVLDGIPLSANKSKQSKNFFEIETQGDNEAISNINPDDIENITALTGAAAAALYGNRGANGVILITTKKGQPGKTRVTYSNNTTFSSPFVMPEFQNTYGQTLERYSSWGPKLDTPSSYRPKDFFRTGYNTMNSFGLSSGSETHQIHLSVGAVNAEGIVPNTEYERYNLTFKSSSQLVKDKLTLDVGLNYIEQKDQNSVAMGLYYNPLIAIYLFPPGDDINRFRPYKIWDQERNFHVQNWSYKNEDYEGVKQNPFWTANKNLFNNKRDKMILSGTLSYKITDWINLTGRAQLDKSHGKFERKLYASTDQLFAKSPKGHFSHYKLEYTNIYADFLVNIDKRLNDNFRLVANAGGSFYDEKSEFDGYKGPLISAVDFFHVSNVNIENKLREFKHMRTNSLYATAQLGYKSILYLDATARIDYFSTMKGPGMSTYDVYPSFGLSSVLSELIPENNFLTFWKIRGSYSQVGNPPDPYLLHDYTTINEGAIESASFYPVKNLKVEKTKAFEIGTDARFWKNKISMALTYYYTNTYNQLFRYDLSPSTGYAYAFQNAGKVNNWGIEASVGYDQNIGPVKWNLNVTYTLNRNKIKRMLPDMISDPISGTPMPSQKEFIVADAGTYRMILKEGGTMSDVYVTSFKRDHNGDIYVNPATGAFEIDQDNFFKIGQTAPKYNLNVRNKFAWKGISLGFLIDARVGGIVVSSTQALMDQFGVSKTSAKARERGGVPINGGLIDARQYYETVAGGKNGAALSEYTYSATNVRLRELTLSYNLPKKWFRDKLDITVSFTGRNLLMFYNRAPFDPELTPNTGTYYQGYDYFMPPSLRNLGFGINVAF